LLNTLAQPRVRPLQSLLRSARLWRGEPDRYGTVTVLTRPLGRCPLSVGRDEFLAVLPGGPVEAWLSIAEGRGVTRRE
jgi:hypothetical protein